MVTDSWKWAEDNSLFGSAAARSGCMTSASMYCCCSPTRRWTSFFPVTTVFEKKLHFSFLRRSRRNSWESSCYFFYWPGIFWKFTIIFRNTAVDGLSPNPSVLPLQILLADSDMDTAILVCKSSLCEIHLDWLLLICNYRQETGKRPLLVLELLLPHHGLLPGHSAIYATQTK